MNFQLLESGNPVLDHGVVLVGLRCWVRNENGLLPDSDAPYIPAVIRDTHAWTILVKLDVGPRNLFWVPRDHVFLRW